MLPRPVIALSLLRRTATVAAASIAVAATVAAPSAHAQSTDDGLNTIVVSMNGQINIRFDKDFVKALSRSKASIRARGKASYSRKTRAATLPIDTTSAISTDPAGGDIAADGTLQMRRKDGRKVNIEDVTLRLQPTGADLGATLRGRHSQSMAALFAVADTRVEQQEDGYVFVNVPMLVSTDFAKAAKRAKLTHVKPGQIMGMMTAEVHAVLPSLGLPFLPGLPPTL